MELDADVRNLRLVLAENIKKRRKLLGFTQEKLAEIADMSQNMVNDIEGLRTWVSDKTIIKLAKALRTEVHELVLPDFNAGDADFFINKGQLLRLKQNIEMEFNRVLDRIPQ